MALGKSAGERFGGNLLYVNQEPRLAGAPRPLARLNPLWPVRPFWKRS